MTTQSAERRTAPEILASQYRRLLTTHPVTVLRWLQNGVLLSLAAAALLYLWVAVQAGSDIAAVQRTVAALANIGQANQAVTQAGKKLDHTFRSEDVRLVGTGADFVNQVTAVNNYLSLAAEGNAAGTEGTADIQYVHNQLASYLQLGETAVRDYALGGPLETLGLQNANSAESDVTAGIGILRGAEQGALADQRHAWALDGGTFWWALLGPVIGALLLVMATADLVARHFRRYVSRWLWASLMITAATMVTAGLFNSADARSLSADPWAGHPATMAIALALLLTAAVLARLAYRPRLAEYRFQP